MADPLDIPPHPLDPLDTPVPPFVPLDTPVSSRYIHLFPRYQHFLAVYSVITVFRE
jgi:hypothetical protein